MTILVPEASPSSWPPAPVAPLVVPTTLAVGRDGRQLGRDRLRDAERAVEPVQAGARGQGLVGEHLTGETGDDEVTWREQPPRRGRSVLAS